MRRAIEDLRTFYGEPTGALVRRLLAKRLDDAWGEANGCDVLGIGYATPWLDAFVGARRVIAAMPSGQGVELWPAAGRNRTLLVDDKRLPFAAGSFDRVLLVHALEEADDPTQLLTEAVRALAWLGPERAGSALKALRQRLPRSAFEELVGVRARLPTWLARSVSMATHGSSLLDPDIGGVRSPKNEGDDPN